MAVPTKASQFTQQPTKNSNSLGSLAREKQWVNSINDNNGFMQYEMQNCWDSNRSECNENSLCGSQLMSTTTTEDSTTESILSCKQSNIGRRLQYSSPMPPQPQQQPQQQPQAQYPQMSQAMNQLLEKYRLSKYISKFEKEGVTIEKLCNYKLSQLDEMKDKIIGHKARIKRNNFDRMMRALQQSLQEQQKANESNEENDIYEQEKKEVESRKYNEHNKSENEKISGRMLEERVRLMKCFEMNKRIGIDKNDNRKWYWLCELGKQHCWIEFDKAIQKILCDQFRKYINSSKNTSASVNFTLSWTNKKSKIVFDRTYFFHETILAAQYDSSASRKLVAFGCPDVNGFIHGMFVGHNNNNDNNNEDDNDSDYERSRFDHSNNNNNNNNSHNHSNNNNNNNNDNSEDSNDGHITASSIDSDADTDQGNDC